MIDRVTEKDPKLINKKFKNEVLFLRIVTTIINKSRSYYTPTFAKV